MIDIHEVISDSSILVKRSIFREGIPFTSITHPGNVYDAVILKIPKDVPCSSPVVDGASLSLEEQISFINRYQIEKAMIIAEDIGFISKCPSLKYLRIIPADSAKDGFDYSPLYGMPQIKSLSCSTVYGFKEQFSTSVDCAKIRGLENIHITSTSFKNYALVKTLRGLGFTNYEKQDLTEAFCSSALDTLSVFQSRIQTLEGIQTSQNLQCLYLYHNRSLVDISALEKVRKTLRALRIENCPKIQDFSILGELDHLELLELSGRNELESLSFLRTMKSLKTFTFSMNVKDGDLRPCQNLTYVFSEKNRKHYNLKDSELPKKEYVRGNESIDEWRRFE